VIILLDIRIFEKARKIREEAQKRQILEEVFDQSPLYNIENVAIEPVSEVGYLNSFAKAYIFR